MYIYRIVSCKLLGKKMAILKIVVPSDLFASYAPLESLRYIRLLTLLSTLTASRVLHPVLGLCPSALVAGAQDLGGAVGGGIEVGFDWHGGGGLCLWSCRMWYKFYVEFLVSDGYFTSL